MNPAIQQDILKELFNISLAKAADSLSFFVRDKIFIKDLSLCVADRHRAMSMIDRQLDAASVILETVLKGDHTGKTYLLFSEGDMRNFFSVAHPINPDARLEDEFSKELLLEVDNILAASVVTELSNILNVSLYGDVPQLIADVPALKTQLSAESDDVVYLQVVANYVSDGMVMEPHFIWLIGSGFFNRIQQFAQVEENVMKIRSLNVPN